MNNIKKTVLGMLIGLLAFGISAYTKKKTVRIVRYYKAEVTYTGASDPSGYYYYSGNRCETGGNLCSAEWDIGTNPAPTIEGTPLPSTGISFQVGSVTAGHFE